MICDNCIHARVCEKLEDYRDPLCFKAANGEVKCDYFDADQTKTSFLEDVKPVYTHCSEELNDRVTELMEDYARLVEKAKNFGLDIRLYDNSVTLELYFNDDYPDTLLVDKDLSSAKKEAMDDEQQTIY